MSNTVTRPQIEAGLLVLDTPDPPGLAAFYGAVLGWKVVRTDPDWVTLQAPTGLGLAFQLAPDFVPSTWPADEVRMHSHLDLDVTDLDAAEVWVVQHGARPVEGPGDNPGFRVFADPTGHIFCLCACDT